MKSERQRFIDEALLRQFAICQSQNPGFVVARAVAFWEERELERERHEEEGKPTLAKTRPAPADKKASSG